MMFKNVASSFARKNRNHLLSGCSIVVLGCFVVVSAYAVNTGVDTPPGVPSLPLAVEGTPVLTLNSDLSSTFAGTVSVIGSNITAPAYYYTSDARLKTDVRPITHALDKLLTINGVTFNWKHDGRADIGVVAQNVAESFPQIVHSDAQGMLSVEYANLVGPMIESIRELKAENDELKSEIQQIRSDIKQAKVASTSDAQMVTARAPLNITPQR